MATIAPGTGGTIKSTILEQHLVEIVNFLQLQELDTIKNPTGIDKISGNININTGIFSATWTVTATQSLSTAGEILLGATNYLPTVTFAPGTGGLFKSTNAVAYLNEVAGYVQQQEMIPAKNGTGQNNINITYDADAQELVGSLALPGKLSINTDGSIKFVANEYLA